MKLIINGEELESCPFHGYPLPCDKCGLGQYELGKQAGIKEVVEWVKEINQEFISSEVQGKLMEFLKKYNCAELYREDKSVILVKALLNKVTGNLN